MTHSVQRGLDAVLSDADLAREAARRQRAKALGLPLDTPEHFLIEAAARLEHRRPFVATPNSRPVRESQVERDGDKLMQSCGFTVIRLSQRRRSKVHVGLADRLFMHPMRQLVVFWEAKAPGGKQRPAQERFQALCVASGMEYVLGGVEELRAWLTRKLEAR